MYAALAHKKGIPVPGTPTEVGAWVNGNAGWGRLIFELTDASGQRWTALAQRARDFQAVPVGKRQIEQQQIRRIALARGDSRLHGMRDRHPSTRLLEENAQRVRHQHIVFDNEDVRLRRLTPFLRNRGW